MITSNIQTDNSPITTVKAKVELYDGSTLVQTCTCSDSLQEFTIDRIGDETKFFGFGVCQKANIKLVDLWRNLSVTTANTIKIGYVTDEGDIYPYPTFYVTEVNRDEKSNTISVTAYDLIYKFIEHTIAEITLESYTIEQIAEECASLLGLTIKHDDLSEFALYYEEGANLYGNETIREIFDAIAEVTQTVYYIDYNNYLYFKRYDPNGDAVLTIGKDAYFDLTTKTNRRLETICHTTELGDMVTAGLRGSKEGNIVEIDDITNEQHELEIELSSKNLIKYPYIETLPITREGITFTSSGHGGIAVTGTATNFAQFRLCDGSFLKDGESYQFGEQLSLATGTVTLHIAYFNENNELRYAQSSPFVWSDKYTFQQCYIQVTPNTVCNGEVIFPAINVGSKHETVPYTPYVDISNVSVRSYGKNLITYPYAESGKTASGITYTDNGDGTITINGTATENYISMILSRSAPFKHGVTYTLSGCDGKLIIRYNNENGAASWATSSLTWDDRYVLETIYVQVNAGETFNNVVWSPMIRRKDASAEYEPYKGVQGVLNDNGIITGITSIHPMMSIATSNKNASVDVRYYRQKLQGTTQYVRDNPFWDLREDIRDLVDNALMNIEGLLINQFECEWVGNYLLEIGDKIALVTEDDKEVYSYVLNDTIIFDGTLGERTQWNYTESEAETATNPTSIGDTIKQTYARVDKANKRIDLVASEVSSTQTQLSTLQINTDSINTYVQEIETQTTDAIDSVNENITTLTTAVESKMSAEDVKLEIRTELDNGVDKVVTNTGFTFNDDGLTVEKSGSEMKTQITEDGMTVYRDDTAVLTANHIGVNATNLHATTYLIIGNNSRFEDYVHNSEQRTGCFWIG